MGMIGLIVVGIDLSNIDDVASIKAIGKSKKKFNALLSGLKQTIQFLRLVASPVE